jgi:hypothetical protein
LQLDDITHGHLKTFYFLFFYHSLLFFTKLKRRYRSTGGCVEEKFIVLTASQSLHLNAVFLPSRRSTYADGLFLCRRWPSAQAFLCRWLSCADGLLHGMSCSEHVPTAPINCRRHRICSSTPWLFPVVSGDL